MVTGENKPKRTAYREWYVLLSSFDLYVRLLSLWLWPKVLPYSG